MFGKQFASMYTGSMFGQPALVFAVMGYVIANQRPGPDGECRVELNPLLLAPMFSAHPSDVVTAIGTLEAPDAISRSAEHDGRRLIRERGEIMGPAQYLVVNGAKYRAIRNEADRREYMREYMRKYRAGQTSLLDTEVEQPPPPPEFNQQQAFDAIWTQVLATKVPSPVAEKAVIKHFDASVKSEGDLARLRAALANYQGSARVARGYVQNASTWFNDWQQWVDGDPSPTKTSDRNGGRALPTPDPAMIRMDEIRETAREVEFHLRQKSWDREDCTREQAVAWLRSVKSRAPMKLTLPEFVRGRDR